MPIAVGCLALFMPRLALVLVWLTSNYLGRAYQTVIWPLLGFLFMPLTTLAYAYAQNSGVGSVSNFGVIVIVIAVLIDLGLLGSGEASRRKHMSRS